MEHQIIELAVLQKQVEIFRKTLSIITNFSNDADAKFIKDMAIAGLIEADLQREQIRDEMTLDYSVSLPRKRFIAA